MMKTRDLQENINNLLDKFAWSKREFAERLFDARAEDEVAAGELERTSKPKNKHNDRVNFVEKVKKDLTRDTVSPELLTSYLDFLKKDPLSKKYDSIIPSYNPMDGLGSEFKDELYQLSKLVTKLVADKNCDE